MAEKIQIKEYKNIIDESEKLQIISLIKEGNPESILAQLSNINISKYLDILIRSKKLYLFTCILENEIIGYAILAEKPKYLINPKTNNKIISRLSLSVFGIEV